MFTATMEWLLALFLGVLTVLVLNGVLALPLVWAWNAGLAPALGWNEITWYEALGFLITAKIILGQINFAWHAKEAK